ncbi:MAG: DUF1566 domain-containing protein [Chlorobiaceae bacterium]|nr:DUF1566 domain-containing protein [Chlorobiaceae bacterium]
MKNTTTRASRIWIGVLVTGLFIVAVSALSFMATRGEKGDRYGGGIVYYILQPGDPGYEAWKQHGLIVALNDQSNGTEWSNIKDIPVFNTKTAIGSGRQNTELITAQKGHISSAAKLCADYAHGDYSDWYLPSRDELNKLCTSNVLSCDYEDEHWSSSGATPNDAWSQIQGSAPHYQMKQIGIKVRAIRSF